MLRVSANVRFCPLLPAYVRKCPQMSANVRFCPLLPANVRNCPLVSACIKNNIRVKKSLREMKSDGFFFIGDGYLYSL